MREIEYLDTIEILGSNILAGVVLVQFRKTLKKRQPVRSVLR